MQQNPSQEGIHIYTHKTLASKTSPTHFCPRSLFFETPIYLHTASPGMNRARPDLNMGKAVAQKGGRYRNIKASLITTDFFFIFYDDWLNL